MLRKTILGAVAALTLSVAGLGFASRGASAEVTAEFWLPITLPNAQLSQILALSCPGETRPIVFTGEAHYVFYTTPEGTLMMRIMGHATGTDEDGTEYVINIQRVMEHDSLAWRMGEFTDTWTTRLISKGSTVNAVVVSQVDPMGTNADRTVVLAACRG